MFNPSKDDVRRFFCEAWRKQHAGEILTPLEAVAVEWMQRHPEYHADLADADAAIEREYRVEDGHANPFLHLSMHLAIAEQLSIDQPPGIRAAVSRLLSRLGDEHAAMHEVMECLGETVWAAQRSTEPVSAEQMSARYLECLERRAAR
jgi:hypothetical protein